MQFSDLTRDLERSFLATSDLLQSLLKELQERRAAWVSARPSVLQPSPAIEKLSQQIAWAEDQRAALLHDIRARIPAIANDPRGDQHLNVTRIAAAMPKGEATTLRAAADRAQSLAKLVRTEVTMGQRLLRFAQRAQDELTATLVGATATARTPSGYDRSARNTRDGKPTGQLIDGRI